MREVVMPLNLEAGVEPVAGYKLIRKLGRGGFGEAWEAEAPGGVRVALKFIRLGNAQAGPELRGLEVIRNIRHPHLLDVQFAVQVEDCLVIAMPLCDESLWDRLKECTKEGPPGLPRDDLLRLMGELAEAVDFLNEPRHPAGDGRLVGVQHRDIKPHNIFLVGGSVRLADFGLAKILEASCARHTGSMSPDYVAPEALKGTVAPQSDQYSLAVTYCQLRTGRLPVTGETIGEVVYNHLHGTPDLSALPEEERPVVGRALAKEPGARWPTCRAFVLGLEAAALAEDGRRGPETEPRPLGSGASTIDMVPITEPQEVPEVPTSPDSPFPRGNARWVGGGKEGRTPRPRWGLWAALGGIGVALFGLAALLSFIPRGGGTRTDRGTSAAQVGVQKSQGPAGPAAPSSVGSAAESAARAEAAQAISKGRPAAESKPGPVAAGQPKAVATPPIAATPTRPAPVQSDRPDAKKGAVAPTAGVEVVLEAILQDVRRLPQEARSFARYFSLNHLLAAGADPEELELHRDALAKAINHLSWQEGLVRPEPIEPTRTVFRVDLRDLGWHQHLLERIVDGKPAGPSRLNLFDLALLEYPYGVVPEDSGTFDRLATEFLGPAGQVRPIPFVRADWFVSTATRPPLYEDFLQLPFTLKELERRLGVDVEADLREGRVRRAGMIVSDVSRHNRAVERHPARHGAYWEGLDFRTSKAEENLLGDPLNLNPAGCEVIFHLPNGLQGYALADGSGNRLEAAPTELVTDKFAEDRTVRNGLSCIRCHGDGMKPFTDAVRPTVERLPGSPGFDRQRVLQLYPGQPEMDRLLKEDAGRFSRALRRALGHAPVGEPLVPVTKRFLQAPLPFSTAAAELGLSGPEDLRNVFRAPALIALGLSPLATEGSVRRDTWEEAYDRVVRALGLGVPVVPLDALSRPDFRPDSAEFDVTLGTNKRTNVFAPDDELQIIVANPSPEDVFIELIGTGARGEKVILAPNTTRVRAGQQYRFPPGGAIKVRGGLGKERITVFASAAEFSPGELLRGQHVVDRVVHRFRAAADRDTRLLKKTIEVETRRRTGTIKRH
jgi:serine/threonine-protein kinase